MCNVVALPVSWSMSINLSRKSLMEATLRRMMGCRGSIHCSFPWPSCRPRFPTLCRAYRAQTPSTVLDFKCQMCDKFQCRSLCFSEPQIKSAPLSGHGWRPFVRPSSAWAGGQEVGGRRWGAASLMFSFELQRMQM